MGKKRATDYERLLANKLWDNGFAVIRAPSSSGTAKMPRPDIFAGSAKYNLLLAMEVKTARQETFYVKKTQLESLLEFSSRMGATPYLCVKFVGKRMDFKFLKIPEELDESTGESYIVNYEKIFDKGMTFNDLMAFVKKEE